MSMHEYEDLVAAAVRALDRARPRGVDLRDALVGLCHWQRRYDTGLAWTGRNVPVLRAHHALYVESLPAAGAIAAAGFRRSEWLPEQFVPGGGMPVRAGTRRARSPETTALADPAAGTASAPAGSPWWAWMCTRGVLTGRDAEAPRRMPAPAVPRLAAEAALAAGDRTLARAWYQAAAIDVALHWREHATAGAWMGDPDVAALRRLGAEHRLLSAADPDGWVEARFGLDGPDSLDDPEVRLFLRWWRAPGAG